MNDTIAIELPQLTATERSVLEQLTENTGRHLLDSGGAYGRSWEQNQGRDFKSEQASSVSVKHGYVDLRHNVFHWLVERCDYQPELDAAFAAWAQSEKGAVETGRYSGTEIVKRADLPWLQSAEAFVGLDIEPGDDLLDYPLAGVATGIYGDGKPFVHNTYNGEDLVSQTLQYVYFTLDTDVPLLKREDENGLDLIALDPDSEPNLGGGEDDPAILVWPAGEYVLLQVHGGCDVRGGYTRPRVYSVTIEDGPSILDNAKASLYCTGEGAKVGVEVEGQEALIEKPYEDQHGWYTDDANNWYGNNGEADIKDVEVVDSLEDVPEDWQGTCYGIKDDDTLRCPVCFGRLEVSSY